MMGQTSIFQTSTIWSNRIISLKFQMGTTLGCKDVFELKESGNSRIILDKIKNGIWIFFRNSFTWHVFSKSYFIMFWNLGTRFREYPIYGSLDPPQSINMFINKQKKYNCKSVVFVQRKIVYFSIFYL